MRRDRTTLVVAALLLAACGGESGPDPATIPASIRITPNQVTLSWIGETVTLQGAVLNSEGLEIGGAVLSWASSDTTIATIDVGGVVSAVGNGASTITATAGTVSTRAIVIVRQEAVAVVKVSGDAQTAEAGATLPDRLVVRADDQGGTPVAGVVISWVPASGSGSATPGFGTTDSVGLAATTWTLGDADESQAIEARLTSGTAVSFGATAVLPEPGSLVVLSVEPAVLVEASTATITGVGFGSQVGQNTVLIDGARATVREASETSLTVTVPTYQCRPPRNVTVTVQRGPEEASAPSSVTPTGLIDLAVGEGVYTPLDADRCVHLVAGGAGREYLIGALSASDEAAIITPVQMSGSAGNTLVASPGVPVSQATLAPPALPVRARSTFAAPAASRVTPLQALSDLGEAREGEARVRAAEDALFERLGGRERLRDLLLRPSRVAGAEGVQAVVPAEGDTLTLYGGFGCSGRPTVRAIAQHVGERTVWLHDIQNPDPPFTPLELAALDDVYVDAIDATLNDYFGPDGDVDQNGRVLVLMTQTVNAEENLAGFVWSGDLLPTTVCAQSNEAEIFYGYVPDANGVVGQTRSRAAVLDAYPSLIAHEVAHVRQMARSAEGAVWKTTWEVEGGATLAEQLTGYRVLGQGPRQNLGFQDWQAGGRWYLDWANDLARYQGYINSTSRTPGAPEQCTWIARASEGNDGPCASAARAPYGVPSTLLRWVLDLWGVDAPGGEQGLMKRMVAANVRGWDNLEAATGEPIESILSGFMAMLWMDGQGFDPFPSWDVWDVFGNVNENARLLPYTSALRQPALTVQVRAGSSSFLRWMPGTAHEPTSLGLRSTGSGVLPRHIVLWLVRLR